MGQAIALWGSRRGQRGKGAARMEASETPRPPASIVRMGLFFYGAMGIAALVWRMWTPGDSILHPSPAAAARAWSVPAALGAGLAAGLVALAISEALTRWTALGQALSDLLAESLGPLDRANAWLLALASGLAEEMFFRGGAPAEGRNPRGEHPVRGRALPAAPGARALECLRDRDRARSGRPLRMDRAARRPRRGPRPRQRHQSSAARRPREAAGLSRRARWRRSRPARLAAARRRRR
jgi:hypothetical protein